MAVQAPWMGFPTPAEGLSVSARLRFPVIDSQDIRYLVVRPAPPRGAPSPKPEESVNNKVRRSRFPAVAVAVLAALTQIACDSGPTYNPMLLTPESLTATAPDVFQARFVTSKGDFLIEVHRDWSPQGADRFYNLVSNGFYDDVRFFRVVAGFMAQFGIHGDSAVAAAWRGSRIEDDPVMQSNTRGLVSYAMGGPSTRTTQVFINYIDNSRLDDMGFSPFGEVVEGMDVVDQLYSDYGDGPPRGTGPNQGLIQSRGNDYLNESFPDLDFVVRATIVQE